MKAMAGLLMCSPQIMECLAGVSQRESSILFHIFKQSKLHR